MISGILNNDEGVEIQKIILNFIFIHSSYITDHIYYGRCVFNLGVFHSADEMSLVIDFKDNASL